MKKNLLALTTFFCVSTVAINAQNTFPANGSVGIGTTAPNTSALLDVTSTSRGLLIPRMTQAQRNAIVSPATGLFIYQTNGTAGFYYYSGTTWTPVSGKGANTSLSNLVTTSINAALLPKITATYDLGSAGLKWGNGYYSGAVQVGAAPAAPAAGMIQWTGADFQGYNGASWLSLTGSGGGGGPWAYTGVNIYNTNSGAVLMGPMSVNPFAGSNKVQIGNPDDPFNPVFSGNDLAIYNADGINGMSFFNSGTSSNWYSTGNFALMPYGGSGFVGIGTATPATKLQVFTGDASYGLTHTNGVVTVGSYVGNNGGWLGTKSNHPLYFFTNNSTALMTITTAGSVGIGTISPATKFQLQTADASYGITHTNGTVTVGTYVGSSGGWIATKSNSPLYFCTGLLAQNGSAQMTLLLNGNVGIGTLNPSYKLSVNGTIQAKEVRVETGWADFVFEKNYKLRSLSEVENYINENNHLPDLPSAKEMQADGLPVAETETKMMQKIEELTLYVIQLQKEIDQLKAHKK
ncbi:MAG TPA: hypothetical protein PKM63_04085 [Panacibacter sp.]|nr:hypothetical protein [Panacibacter sp.]HNP43438.1 hypothetical protein [Panacibacter sp.]